MGEAKRRIKALKDIQFKYNLKTVTHARFNAFVGWTRTPMASVYSHEVEWFSDADERILGVILKDSIDNDYVCVILARDAKNRFRCIDVKSSFTSINDAREAIFEKIHEHSATCQSTFEQGDELADKAGVDLFTPLVADDRLAPAFKLLIENDCWFSAKSILEEMAHNYIDMDGNFVEQFQTTGFDSRLWELYLYAFLLEQEFFVERPKIAPDFCAKKGKTSIFIEAVTVNPTKGEEYPQTINIPPKFRPPEEIKELLNTKMPIKFGSTLFSKLNRKKPYWQIPDVQGSPLVFAIADFHEPQSMLWSSSALFKYLYGIEHDFFHDENGNLVIDTLKVTVHKYNEKEIPSGFFFLPNSENISAVIFTASGTLAKFNRMGRLAGFKKPNIRVFRFGLAHDHNENASVPRQFIHEIDEGCVEETWSEGVSMYHNPRAKNPVDHRLFPTIAHHWFIDNKIKSILPNFHPYSSMTQIMKMHDA